MSEDQHAKTLSKFLDISNAKARIATDLLKAIATLSNRTVRRSAIDREENQKKDRISLVGIDIRSGRSLSKILKYRDHQ